MQAKGFPTVFSIENCTIADNQSSLSGGGLSATDSASVTNKNTILWGNSPQQLSGTVDSRYSCVQEGTSGTGIVTGNPSLTPVSYSLQVGSSCTNAGTNAIWMASASDIDGESRVGDSIVDIGADELYDGDDDGMADAWEFSFFGGLGMDGTADSDGDGLSDADEFAWDTDPTDSDTDDDGVEDGAEVDASSSPTSAWSEDVLQLDYRFGDTNGSSDSEKYSLSIISTADSSDGICETNSVFGVEETGSYNFTKGSVYDVTFEHYVSDTSWPTVPDYDYEVYIEEKGGPIGWIFGAGFVISDTNGILGNHWQNNQTFVFDALNKTSQLYILKVDIDVDIDGDGSFDESEDEMSEDDAPGKLVGVNWDDDNTNSILDYLDTACSTNEDDLVEMRLDIGPSSLNVGEVVLEITEGTNCIKVWTNQFKGGSPLLGVGVSSLTNWTVGSGGDIANLGAFPYTNLWVEGITNSGTAGDVQIEFRYEDTNGVARCADTNTWTVVRVDLDIDSDNDNRFRGDQYPERNGEEEDIENEFPGKVVILNLDDDNGDGICDCDDAMVNDGTNSWSKDFLDMADLVLECNPPVSGSAALWLHATDYSNIRVFKSSGFCLIGPESASPYPVDTSLFTNGVERVHIEGISNATTRIGLTLGQGASVVFHDQLLVKSTDTLADSVLGLESLLQFKDTPMVCTNCVHTSLTNDWNTVHVAGHDCDHCDYYCVPTSVKMLNEYYGGSLTRDQIYSGQTNIASHTGLNGSQLHTASEVALGGSVGDILTVFDLQEYLNAIVSYRPLVGLRTTPSLHVEIVAGFLDRPSSTSFAFRVHCPTVGVTNYLSTTLLSNQAWANTPKNQPVGPLYIHPTTGSPAAAESDADIADSSGSPADDDGDGIIDYDEKTNFNGPPFNFLWNNADSNSDTTNDMQELYQILWP